MRVGGWVLQAKYVQPAKYVHLAKYLQNTPSIYTYCVFTEKVDPRCGSVDIWRPPAKYVLQWVRL